MTLRISLDLYELTYGQLFDFADAIRASGVSRDTEVTQIVADEDENIIERFEREVDGLPRANVTIKAEDADDYARAIQGIVNEDGDARRELTTLNDMLATLRG